MSSAQIRLVCLTLLWLGYCWAPSPMSAQSFPAAASSPAYPSTQFHGFGGDWATSPPRVPDAPASGIADHSSMSPDNWSAPATMASQPAATDQLPISDAFGLSPAPSVPNLKPKRRSQTFQFDPQFQASGFDPRLQRELDNPTEQEPPLLPSQQYQNQSGGLPRYPLAAPNQTPGNFQSNGLPVGSRQRSELPLTGPQSKGSGIPQSSNPFESTDQWYADPNQTPQTRIRSRLETQPTTKIPEPGIVLNPNPGQPMEGTVYGQPADGTAYGQPMEGTVYGQPADSTVYGQPTSSPQWSEQLSQGQSVVVGPLVYDPRFDGPPSHGQPFATNGSSFANNGSSFATNGSFLTNSQPQHGMLPTGDSFRPDLGQRAAWPTQRNLGTHDAGQHYDFETKKWEYPPMSEILATGRFFGSAQAVFLRPSFQNNTAISTLGSGFATAQTFDFDYESMPQFRFGFESKYGPGVELEYWQFDETSDRAGFTSDGTEIGSVRTWMTGPGDWSQLVASSNGQRLDAEHSIDMETFGVSFFKELKFPISRLNGKFGFQYVSIAQNLDATLSTAGIETGRLNARSDMRAWGPKFAMEYYRPVGHTKLELVTTFGGAVMLGRRDQFILNTADVDFAARGSNELITMIDFSSGVQYKKMTAENRAIFAKAGVIYQSWIGGGTAIDPQGDFGLRGFSFAVGYNR